MTDDQQIYELEVASKVELVAMVNRWKSAYDQLYVHHQQTSEQHEARLRMLSFELDQLKKMIFGSRHERFVTSEQNPDQLSLGIQTEPV